jgi:hypothetical protein
MSKHQAELLSDSSSGELLAACERASDALGWRVTKKHATGLTCVQIAPTPLAIGNPATVEVNLSSTPDGATKITLIGKNFGLGPFQSNYVKQRVQEFCDAIKRAVAQQVPSDATVTGSRNVFINGLRLSDEQLNSFERMYHTHIQDGVYWYDRICGAWGVQGGPTLGFIKAGLDISGQLREDASGGDTGVFINGRQLHRQDVIGLQQLGPVLPGRYWVDAMGNIGFEGGMMIGNLWLLAKHRLANGARGGGPWAVYGGGGVAAGDGQGALFAQFGDLTWSNR